MPSPPEVPDGLPLCTGKPEVFWQREAEHVRRDRWPCPSSRRSRNRFAGRSRRGPAKPLVRPELREWKREHLIRNVPQRICQQHLLAQAVR